MSAVWFTSDLHFGHEKVANLRGFIDPSEHDRELVDNWRKMVRPEDQVWVLGDLSGGSSFAEDRALGILSTLPGEKHLISGNHDSVWPGHRNAHRKQRKFLEVFESVQPFAKRKMAGREVLLSHFPYAGDHTATDRYADFRLKDTGKWLIHGHVHDAWWSNGQQINVGVDMWQMAPIPIHELIYWMDWIEKCDASVARMPGMV